MEVVVDDTQLSLAIGKKGQNVRLAAKLLGWRIDIKSEEEKRQEVESQMAALVVPGAPVSVLVDHGMAETTVEKLMEAGIGTVEQLGSMTPEQLEEIPTIGPDMVDEIQQAVVAYYGQFEEASAESAIAVEGVEGSGDAPEAAVQSDTMDAQPTSGTTDPEAEQNQVAGADASAGSGADSSAKSKDEPGEEV
jgi:N utilization substance protein A